jgi:signal transduction histidine kinase
MIQRVTQWANWTKATQLARWGAAEVPPLPIDVATAPDAGCTRVECTRERTAVLEASLESTRASLADAQQADRLKDTFLAMASHELRAPLQATLYWAELLRANPTPALASEAARHIIHNVHVQSRLIDDLLDISRFLTGQLHLEWRRTDPVEVVQKAAEVVRAEASGRGITIDVQRVPTPVVMTTDPVRLEQVAWNLISNAVHASADGATVQVRMQVTGDSFRLEVQDSGVGIEASDIAQIFETFHRSASTDRHGGLGLGLPITRSIVEQFAGRIAAFSDGPGCGALFTVELPLCGAPSAA